MPAKAKEIERVAKKLGFEKVRQKGSHARWKHPDGRATTIRTTRVSEATSDTASFPIHGKAEIGSWLFQEILKQMGITEEEFNRLK